MATSKRVSLARLPRFGLFMLIGPVFCMGNLEAQQFTDATNLAAGMPRHSLVAIADLDNNGVDDLVVNAHDSSNDTWSTRLWKRQTGLSYSDSSAGSGLQGLEAVSAGDFNNDGSVDFIHLNGARTEAAFYRNSGSGVFSKVAIPAVESSALFGFQDGIRAVDIDSDGDLDLVFGKAVGSGGSIVAVLNQSRNGSSASQPFSGVSTLAVTSWIHNKAEVTDANGDGKPDLLSIRTAGDWPSGTHPDFPVTLFLNSGASPGDYLHPNATTTLAGFTQRDSCGINAANVMSPLASWDIDNDGDLDLINGSSDWPSVSRPHIYINDGTGNYTQSNSPVYQSDNYYHHWISLFDADLDNDMDAVWTSLHNFANTYPRMWRNDGNLTFDDVTSVWGITARIPGWGNHGMSGYHADLDGDGDFDFVVDITNGWGSEKVYAIYRNNAVQNGANWLGIKLASSISAPNGIGARVEVTANGKKLTQYMADTTGGVRNLSSLRFGLGSSIAASSVKVYWPSGQVTRLSNIGGNQVLTISESGQPTDSDNDGVNDYREAKDGTDPNNASSFNPLSKGLVGYFPLRGNISDESGNGLQSENVNCSFGKNRRGEQNAALRFDGSQYARVKGLGGVLGGSSEITISAWYLIESGKSHPLGYGSGFIEDTAQGEAKSPALGVGVSGDPNNAIGAWMGAWKDAFTSTKFPMGSWAQITTVLRVGSSPQIYLNGKPLEWMSPWIPPVLAQPIKFASDYGIGAHLSDGQPYWGSYSKGGLSDLRFYNRALSATEVGQLYKAESENPNMIAVKGGTLPQGSELAGQKVEDFRIGKYEVTWGEWKAVRDWAVTNGYTDLANVGAGSGDEYPVRNVYWYDAVKWCNAKSQMERLVPVYKLNGGVYKTGQSIPAIDPSADGYRLPVEKEWEWAARGGVLSKGYKYSGSNDLNAVAWYKDNSLGAPAAFYDGRGTYPVGLKQPNELGVYDMAGNAMEWCWDYSATDVADYRIVRGGAFHYPEHLCAVEMRFNEPAGTESDTYLRGGFRVARNAPSNDTTAPVVKITSIAANARLTTATATFAGTVTETGSKPTLQYRLGTTGAWLNSTVGGAASPYSFSQSITLKPGPNAVQFQAQDAAGNKKSAVAAVNVSYVVPATLNVAVPNAADGSISSGFGGNTPREVGVTYTITATPASGMVFKEWLKNGTSFSTNAALTFKMEAGLKLTPVFVPDFAKLGGVYNGLVGTGQIGSGSAADRQAFAASNGFIQINTAANGALSGVLRIQGGNHPFTGTMGANKKATLTITRPGKAAATAVLNLITALPGEISGTVTAGGAAIPFRALRGGHTASTGTHALGGRRYSIVLPPPAGIALGYGYGALTVDNDGSAVLAARLATGQAINAGARIVDDGKGNWVLPVYVGAAGIFTGEIIIPKTAPASGSEVSGSLEWLKPAGASGPARNGFLAAVQPLGARHNIAAAGLGGATFRLTLDSGRRILSAPVVQSGQWGNGAAPGLTAPIRSSLSVGFNPINGEFRGSFTRTNAGLPVVTPFQGGLFSRPITVPGGTVLRGAGFFTDGNASTTIEVTSP